MGNIRVYKNDKLKLYHVHEDNKTPFDIPFGLIATNFINMFLSLESKETYTEYAKYLKETNCPVVLNDKVDYDDIKAAASIVSDRIKACASFFADFQNKTNEQIAYFYHEYKELFNEAVFAHEYEFSALDISPETDPCGDYADFMRIANEIRKHKGYTFLVYGDNEENTDLCLLEHYEVPGLNYMFPVDLAMLLTSRHVMFCKNCGRLYATFTAKQEQCDFCKYNRRRITYQKEKQSVRSLHTKILNYYNSVKRLQGVSSDPFRLESNYYWSIIQGKQPKTPRLDTYKDITTEKQYMQWLEKFFADLKTK